MYEIENMTQSMVNDGFIGEWYSIIHMGKAYRVQVNGDEYKVQDNYMNKIKGELADELIAKTKEYRHEER